MSGPIQEYTTQQRANMKASFYATKPTRFTLFLRTFLPWQIWRFIRINLMMLVIIRRSHKGH
jgi:formate hydrogenlyase subunit 4